MYVNRRTFLMKSLKEQNIRVELQHKSPSLTQSQNPSWVNTFLFSLATRILITHNIMLGKHILIAVKSLGLEIGIKANFWLNIPDSAPEPGISSDFRKRNKQTEELNITVYTLSWSTCSHLSNLTTPNELVIPNMILHYAFFLFSVTWVKRRLCTWYLCGVTSWDRHGQIVWSLRLVGAHFSPVSALAPGL